MSHHSGAEVKLWAFLYQLFLLYCHSVRHGMAAVLRHHFKIISGWTARQLYTYSQEDDSQADSVTLATVGMDFWLCCMSLSSSTTCLFLPVQCLFQTSAPHTGSCCYWVMLSWQFGPFYKVKSQINPHPPPRTYTHTQTHTHTHTHTLCGLLGCPYQPSVSVNTGQRRCGQENHPANQEGHRRLSGAIRSDVGAVQACSCDSQVTAASDAAVAPCCVHRNPTRS